MCSPRSGAPSRYEAHVALHLRLVFSGYPEGLIEVAHGRRLPGGRLVLGSRRRPGDYVPVADPGRAAALVARAAVRGEEVFVGVLPRRRPAPRREEVCEARCVWLDLDSADAFLRARAFRPAPHLAVASGSGGGHCYWLLTEPVAPEAAEEANRRLAAHLGADPASCDRLRLLRAPGSPNHKAGQRARLVCARPTLARYELQALLAGVPEPQRAVPARLPGAPIAPASDPLRQVPPRVWFSRLTGAVPDAAGFARCPLHADAVASLKLYAEPERGWCCYAGCGAGSVYDFASRLWGIGTRGRDFTELRRRLREALGV